MTHLARALLLLALPLAATAGAAVPTAQDPEIPVNPAPGDTKEVVLHQVDSRLTVPVNLGGADSYNFIIDTGAERTSISRDLASRLGLAAGTPVSLTSMTGTSMVDTVVVPRLEIKSLGKEHSIVAPALERRNLGAAGLLGIDTLQDHRVTIDFDAGLMTVAKSEPRGRRPRARDEVVVTARNQFGQLIVTNAFYRGVRVQVLIDTGSMITLGNEALRKRVVKSTMRAPQVVRFTSVTGESASVDYTAIPDVQVGDIQFGMMPIAFADVEPFRRYGIEDRPALILGMDSLASFRRVEIDFPNRQIRFRVPPPDPRTAFSLLPGVRSMSARSTFIAH